MMKFLIKDLSEAVKSVTNNIEISVRTVYLDDLSDTENSTFAFGYFIEIRNSNPEAVQLLSREWIIEDANKNKKIVTGEGVVGKQPILEPKEIFNYNSWVNIATPLGQMKGYFTMQSISEKQNLKIAIPSFQLLKPGSLH